MTGKKRSLQNGVSLVGMMVGMTISMIVILGMLTVYKTTARVTAEAGKGAATDGQRLAALFAAQSLLQEAGFGISSPSFDADLVVVAGASMAGNILAGATVGALPANGNAIVWAAKIDGKMLCNGLYAPTTGGLVRLATVNCPGASAADSWGSIAWTQVVLVQDDTATRAVLFEVSKVAPPCQSFGIGGSGNLLAKLKTRNSTTDANQVVVATTCLSNF